MSSTVLIAALGVALAATLVFLAVLKWKHRLIWKKLWSLEDEIRSTTSNISSEFESAFKQLAKQRFAGTARLELKLPSQHGEDVLLWNFFDRKTEGYFVEVGAFDGVTLSNSYFFEAIGWSGTLVEAVPAFCEEARTARPYSRIVNKAVGDNRTGHVEVQVGEGEHHYLGAFSFVGSDSSGQAAHRIKSRGGRIRTEFVESASLDEILGELACPIDFITIDVEGHELEVLEHFSLDKYAPQVLVIEDNSNGKDRRVSDRLAWFGYVERLNRGPNVFYTKIGDRREFTWV